MSHFSKRSALLAATALMLVALNQSASAQTSQPVYQFNIPAEDLVSALKAFAKTSGQQFIYDADSLSHKLSHQLQGSYTIDSGLRGLIAGNGLSLRYLSGGAIEIDQMDGTPSSTAIEPKMLLPEKQLSGGQLEEVIVTAERKSENLQKTAAAVTVINGTKLQQQGESDLEEIVRDLPGVNVTNQTDGATANIRGQGADLPPSSGQGAVAMEFDGVYDIMAEAGLIGYFDVNRIEVLPGPQGTLYGVNADGGVINVIYNDPTIGKYSGYASVNLGNYHLYHAEGAINLPIGDVLALRISGAAINRGSYLTPAAADAVGQSARVKLLYKPTDDLSVRLAYQLDHIGGRGQGGSVLSYQNGSVNDRKNPWQGLTSSSGFTPSNSHERYYQNDVNADVDYNLDDVARISIMPAYERIRGSFQSCGGSDNGGNGGPGQCSVGNYYSPFYQFSSEERVNNPIGSRIQWDVGAYHWNYSEFQNLGAFGNQILGAGSNAGFGEITYPVAANIRLIGGIRETFDSRFLDKNNGSYDGKFHHFDYRAGAEYDYTPSSMEYATVSTGYRAGGFNVLPNNTVDEYTNESITSFEFGSKNRLIHNTLQINADFFYYIQKNYQLWDVVQNPAICNGPSSFSNPACSGNMLNLQAHTEGFEFQTRYNATADDQVNFSGSWLAAYFDKQSGPCASPATGAPATGCYVGGNDPVTNAVFFDNASGEVQPHAPAFSANLTYNHIWNLGNGGQLTGGAEFYFATSYYVAPIENAYSRQPSYWTQGLTLNYTPPAGKWSLNAYVHNLSNYAVKDQTGQSTTIGEPRTFGISAQIRW